MTTCTCVNCGELVSIAGGREAQIIEAGITLMCDTCNEYADRWYANNPEALYDDIY